MVAVREARRNLELLVRVQVRSQAGPVQDLASSPEWLAVRAGILRALEPYPEARYAVSEEMLRLVGEQVGDGLAEHAGQNAGAPAGQEQPDGA